MKFVRTLALVIGIMFSSTVFGDLATNGSFEKGSEGWELPNKNFSIVKGGAKEGSFSLKYQGSKVDGHAFQQVTGLQKNTDYTISVWLKIDPGSKGGILFDTNGRFKACKFWYQISRGEWQKFTGSFNSGNFADVTLRCFVSNQFEGSCYLDAVSVTPGWSAPSFYTDVPDPLTAFDGTRITTRKEWESKRRPEILERYTSQYYGRVPEPGAYTQEFEVIEDGVLLFDAAVKRKTVKTTITGPKGSFSWKTKMWLPVSKKPVPVIMLCNHRGRISDTTNSGYMPLPMILERGYGVVAYEMNDVAPGGGQSATGWKDGLFSIFNLSGDDAWQNKGVWTFGGLRVLDYLFTDPEIERVATAGQSRGGTLSMWLSANDQRVSYCIANNAGHGGFVLWAFKSIDGDKTFWPCKNYMAHKKSFPNWDLGLDGHLLISLIAPRLFAGGTANGDKPHDFQSQYYSCVYSQPVWALYDLQDEEWTEKELTFEPIVRRNGNMQFHVADHRHDLKEWDWKQYLGFADDQWKSRDVK